MCSTAPVGTSNKRVGRHMRCCLGTSTICVASALAGMQGMQQHVMPISPEGGNRSVDMQQQSLLSERQHPEWSQHPTVRCEFSRQKHLLSPRHAGKAGPQPTPVQQQYASQQTSVINCISGSWTCMSSPYGLPQQKTPHNPMEQCFREHDCTQQQVFWIPYQHPFWPLHSSPHN